MQRKNSTGDMCPATEARHPTSPTVGANGSVRFHVLSIPVVMRQSMIHKQSRREEMR